ncbi:hypothetical protein HMPREF0262_03425 [Clostridium sp. ATCC 29733]|nr:hypothetical protein HMPREF0262_03425 [Clostridium sp. ATCC 29733]
MSLCPSGGNRLRKGVLPAVRQREVPPGRQSSSRTAPPSAAPFPAKQRPPPLFPPGGRAMPCGFCSPSPRAG